MILFAMRIIALLVWINIEIQRFLYLEGYHTFFYRFYTNWTFYIWGAWLFCIVTSQTKYYWLKKEAPGATEQPLQLWKVCSILYSTSFLHSIMVSTLYFTLIYPTLTELDLLDYMKHSVPLFFLVLEFFANNIVIEANYYVPVIGYGILYLLWLVYYTTAAEDQWIYSVLKLESNASWGLLFAIALTEYLVFQVIRLLSSYKFARALDASQKPE